VITTPASAPKSVGFFGRLIGWLTGSATASEEVVVAPADVVGKPKTEARGNQDRNNRNRNRNRSGRNNRNESEERTAAAAPAASGKQAKPVITDGANSEAAPKNAKGARPPRETHEARRERQQKEREERAAKKAANLALNPEQESLAQVGASAESQVKVLADTDSGAVDDVKLDQVAKGEVGDGDEPRRRRRRGGRNRNRRDRDAGENATPEQATRESSEDFIPVADIAEAEQHQVVDAAAQSVAEPAFVSVPAVDAVMVNSPASLPVEAPVAVQHVAEQPVNAHHVDVAPAITPTESTAAEATSIESSMAAPVPSELVVESGTPATPVVAVIPTQVELKFEAVSEVKQPVVEPELAKQVVQAPVVLVAEAVPVTHTTSNGVVATPAAVPTQPLKAAPLSASPVTKVEDMQEMLSSAGLILAATDPNKLRNAQLNAIPVAQPRAPRMRKPPVEISNEPLQLVQTKQPPM